MGKHVDYVIEVRYGGRWVSWCSFTSIKQAREYVKGQKKMRIVKESTSWTRKVVK